MKVSGQQELSEHRNQLRYRIWVAALFRSSLTKDFLPCCFEMRHTMLQFGVSGDNEDKCGDSCCGQKEDEYNPDSQTKNMA